VDKVAKAYKAVRDATYTVSNAEALGVLEIVRGELVDEINNRIKEEIEDNE
jgi:nitrogen regulatory protein PII-like uncharacterized protein